MTVEAVTETVETVSEARTSRKSALEALRTADAQIVRALRKAYGRSGLTASEKQDRLSKAVTAIEVAEVALVKARQDLAKAVAFYGPAAQAETEAALAAQAEDFSTHAEIMALVDEAAAEEYQVTH